MLTAHFIVIGLFTKRPCSLTVEECWPSSRENLDSIRKVDLSSPLSDFANAKKVSVTTLAPLVSGIDFQPCNTLGIYYCI